MAKGERNKAGRKEMKRKKKRETEEGEIETTLLMKKSGGRESLVCEPIE